MPLDSFMKVVNHARELTPESTKLTHNAMIGMLAPMPMPSLMDVDDAKECLNYVAKKVVTRAAKRKAEAEAAADAKNARLYEMGAKRAAKRAAIAARLPSTSIVVDNALRVHRY